VFKKCIVFTIFITSPLLICQSSGLKKAEKECNSVVKQVDHIMLAPDNPQELFEFLTQELKLPIAWPYRKYESFASGGIFAGNVNLEPVFFQQKHESLKTPTKIIGMAFEPSAPTEKILQELDLRKIPYMKPEIMALGPEGSKMKIATNTILKDMLPGSYIFICEHHIYKLFNTDLPTMRKKWQNDLMKVNGGPLGIEYVCEIKIKIKNKAEAFKKWKNLLKPCECIQDGCSKLGNGPSLIFLDSEQECIYSLKIKVRSLEKACNYLSSKGLILAKNKHTVTANPEKTFGILFEFTEIDDNTGALKTR
jgi:hypothetical protein